MKKEIDLETAEGQDHLRERLKKRKIEAELIKSNEESLEEIKGTMTDPSEFDIRRDRKLENESE